MLYFAMPPRSFLSYDYQNDKDSISNVVTTEKTKFEAECQTQFDDNNDLDEQWMNLVKQMDNDRSHITYNLSELALSFCDKLLEMSNDVFPWTNDVTYQFLATVVGISRWISKITPCSGDCTDSNKEALDKLNFYSKKWKRGVETKNPGKTQYLFFLNYDFVANLSDFTQNFPTASHEQQTSMIQTLVLQLIFLFETGFKFQSAAIELFELAQNTIDSVSQENPGSENEIVMFCNICLNLIRVGVRLLPSFSVKALKKVKDGRFSKTFLPESDDLSEVLLNNLAESLSKLRHSFGTGNGHAQIQKIFEIVEHENQESYQEYQPPEKKNSQTEEPPSIKITRSLRLPLRQINSSELAEFETERSQILKLMEFCVDVLTKEKTEISSDYYIEPIIIGEEKTELAPGHDSKPNTV
jgi:hypothetical protein